jgi:two-component system sensor histidine kinase KdpD
MSPVSPVFQPWWRSYGLAFLGVATATGCVGLFDALFSLPAFLCYIAAITVSTAYGGIGPGLVAAALGLFASNYLFIPPSFSLESERSVLPLAGYYLSAVILSALLALRWRFWGRRSAC